MAGHQWCPAIFLVRITFAEFSLPARDYSGPMELTDNR